MLLKNPVIQFNLGKGLNVINKSKSASFYHSSTINYYPLSKFFARGTTIFLVSSNS